MMGVGWPGLAVPAPSWYRVGHSNDRRAGATPRSGARWASDLLALAPRGLEALSQGMRQEALLGLAALVLLVPLGLALTRVLARVPGRK